MPTLLTPDELQPQKIELVPVPESAPTASPTDLVSVVEMAIRCLRECPYAVLRRVTCTFENGVLTLLGVLPSFHMLQLAINAVKDIPGVEQINNKIEVVA